MLKTEPIYQESRADTTCQICLLLGIKNVRLTTDDRESHESLHKRQAQALLFGFENSESVVDSQKDKDDEEIQDAKDNDDDRDRINKDNEIECINDVQGEIAANRYPTPTKGVVGNNSKPELRMEVARWNSKIRYQHLTNNLMKNFDAATIRILKEGIKRSRQQSQLRHKFKCLVCFVTIPYSYKRSNPWGGLIDHARLHIGKLCFQCSSCSYECVTKGQIYRHKYLHHNGCTDANWSMIERKMKPEDLEELQLVMMRCMGCKRSDAAAVENGDGNGFGKTTEHQSGSRSESMPDDVEMSCYPNDVNAEKFDENPGCLLKQRLSLCRRLICQNANVDGQSICQLCLEQDMHVSVDYRRAYAHVMYHASLPIYRCNLCSVLLPKSHDVANHIRDKHRKTMRNNYTNRSDEVHTEIVTWILKCFGSVKESCVI